MELKITGLRTETLNHHLDGGLDAHDLEPEVVKAGAGANPCRHCLGLIEADDEMLILAYRPFAQKQAYAEVGPIFLHGSQCQHYRDSAFPKWLAMADQLLVRGYTGDHLINYETAEIISGAELEPVAVKILERSDVSYLHVRSKFNCFLCRVESTR